MLVASSADIVVVFDVVSIRISSTVKQSRSYAPSSVEAMIHALLSPSA